jgi:hypothetical protein
VRFTSVKVQVTSPELKVTVCLSTRNTASPAAIRRQPVLLCLTIAIMGPPELCPPPVQLL